MADRSQNNNSDDVASASFWFEVPGHETRYNLSALLPYYGTAFCERLAQAWRRATMFENGKSAYNYFQTFRKCLVWIAAKGISEPGSAECLVMECLRDGLDLSHAERAWAQAISNVAGAILDNDNKTFINTERPTSRNKKLEGLRASLERVSREGLVPYALPEGRLEERGTVAAKCLATLSYEAGRLDITGLSPKDAYEAFIRRNREMLDELRLLLWAELKHNFEVYSLGQSLDRDHAIDLETLEQALNLHTLEEIAKGKVSSALGLDKDQELAAALMLMRVRAKSGSHTVAYRKERAFLGRIISHAEAQPYFEATTIALNAAYHIVLIDTGANPQPIDDLPLNVFRASAKRGTRKVVSLRTHKNRSGGKAVPSNLADEEFYLSTQSSNGMPSGKAVVEIWKTLSASMREEAGPTAERLWVWRKAGETRVRTAMSSMASERWPAFLKRIQENPLVGGLAITRPVIRKAVTNARGEEADLDFAVRQALLGHSAGKTSFQYLSEGAVLGLLNSRIRDFLNAWEGVALSGVDQAATLLGVPADELYRRQQLGLSSGLGFAKGGSMIENDQTVQPSDSLSRSAKILSASTSNLIALELARRALRQQYDAMVKINPARFLRVWVPWFAIVEGYYQLLESSRFRVRLRKAREEVERRLETGVLRLPILW